MENNSFLTFENYSDDVSYLKKILNGEVVESEDVSINLKVLVNIMSDVLKDHRKASKATQQWYTKAHNEAEEIRNNPRGVLGDEKFHLWKEKVRGIEKVALSCKQGLSVRARFGYAGVTVPEMRYLITVMSIARELRNIPIDDIDNDELKDRIINSNHLSGRYKDESGINKIVTEVRNLLKYKLL